MKVYRQHAVCQQSGATLVELIIGMTLGLLIIAAVSTAYIAGQQTQTLSLALSRQQENARIANYFLSDAIVRAGYRQDEGLLPIQVFDAWPPVVGYNATNNLVLDDTAEGSAYYSPFGQLDLTLSVNGSDFQLDNIEQSSDVVGILFQGDDLVTNCLGAPLAAGTLRYEFFYINYRTQNTSGSKLEFECKGYEFDGSSWNANPILAQPLADDVVEFQVQYGVDTDGDGNANQYLDWSSAIEPYSLVSLRYQLTLKGGSPVENLGDSLTSVTEEEKVLREFSHEVSLKNLRR